MSQQKITLRISKQSLQALDRHAAEQERSREFILRAAVAEYLENHQVVVAKPVSVK